MGRRFQLSVVRRCAAVACAMAAFGAGAQVALSPQVIIERAQSTGVLAGLQRAVSTPLEVVWLRTAAELETWNGEGLAGATVGRTGWRYIFGGAAQFAPAPNAVARLVVSSLSLPKAPISAGTLDLAGRGRLFVISPEAPGRAAPEQVALVLAAGSTLQVSDTAAPGLQIEIKAPEHRPLLLGNLASASVRRMLAHLVKPNAISASQASLRDGRLALRTGGEIELAAIVDARTAPSAPAVAVAAAPAPAPIEAPVQVAVVEVKNEAAPPAPAPAEVAPIESAQAKPALVEIAAAQPEPVIAPLELPAATAPDEPVALKPAPFEVAAIKPEPVGMEAEAPAEPVEHIAATAAAEPEAPAQPAPIVAALAPIAPIEAPAPQPVAAAPAPVAIAAIPAKPVIAIIEASPPPAKTPQQAASIERMRAEIEAEIARDRERLAHQREHAAPAKRFVLGV